MKSWIWGSMFVVYLVIGTGLLMRAFYNFWQDNKMRRSPLDSKAK